MRGITTILLSYPSPHLFYGSTLHIYRPPSHCSINVSRAPDGPGISCNISCSSWPPPVVSPASCGMPPTDEGVSGHTTGQKFQSSSVDSDLQGVRKRNFFSQLVRTYENSLLLQNGERGYTRRFANGVLFLKNEIEHITLVKKDWIVNVANDSSKAKS